MRMDPELEAVERVLVKAGLRNAHRAIPQDVEALCKTFRAYQEGHSKL